MLPFTHWSIRKLARYLAGRYGRTDPRWAPARIVRIGRGRLRQVLHAYTSRFSDPHWKESHDPDLDAKLDRIEEVTDRFRTGVSPSTRSGHCRGRAVAARPPGARPASAVTSNDHRFGDTPGSACDLDGGLARVKRILELNPTHPLVTGLRKAYEGVRTTRR
jgi:hypothetical protein